MNIQLRKHWTIYLIHHAHTDIGYTDTPTRIRRYHIQFINEVLAIRRRILDGKADEMRGFKWNSECFWSIEQWLQTASAEQQRELADAIRDRTIGISATYLHFTELIGAPLLLNILKRSVDYGKSIGVTVDSAISADINGFSWGTVDAMAKIGIKNLMTCVHSHHGLAPIGKRQLPFRWESNSGSSVLVWNGEHYMLGNVLGLCPRGTFTYTYRDELSPVQASEDQSFYVEKRLPRYLAQLEKDNYPYEMVPIGVSGMVTDNAPPNGELARFVNEWNAQHGKQIQLKMTTLSEFFAELGQKKGIPIPTYRGDWPDWWSDGVAALPEHTLLFRQAQRTWHALRQIPQAKSIITESRATDIENKLALYAEHTFSHSDSMHCPWDIQVKLVSGEKKAVAYRVAADVEDVADDVRTAMGQVLQKPDVPMLFRAFNPAACAVKDLAYVFLETSEFNTVNLVPEIYLAGKNRPLTVQKTRALRGIALAVRLDLGAHESTTLELRSGIPTLRHSQRCFTDTPSAPDVRGAEEHAPIIADSSQLTTLTAQIQLDPVLGIKSLVDRNTGRNLMDVQSPHSLFVPVYERTPAAKPNDSHSMLATRGAMGRNRKGANVQRTVGQCSKIEVVEVGPLFSTVALTYTVPGASLYTVLLTAFSDLPRIDARIRINKDTIWEPENLYISLPFTSGQLWGDKAGALVRPWRDQLPDTLTDYYCLQEGFCRVEKELGIAVATPDTPLLQVGPLDHGPRRVMGNPELQAEPSHLYSWAMTNYWETNFEASLGGFYEFRYHIAWGKELADPAKAIEMCRAMNLAYQTFRVGSA